MYFRSFKILCQAELYVAVDRTIGKLVVQKNTTEHNHETGEDVFMRYPEQRRLHGSTEHLAKTMLNVRVKVKILQEHLQQSEVNI